MKPVKVKRVKRLRTNEKRKRSNELSPQRWGLFFILALVEAMRVSIVLPADYFA
jgi:hypothetical protein